VLFLGAEDPVGVEFYSVVTEILWKSMEIHGNLWKSMEIHGNLWESCGNPWFKGDGNLWVSERT
jgi:hypothetical protein